MSPDPIQRTMSARATAPAIDAGLQAHMRSVYNNMCYGLAITAGTAYLVATIEPLYNFVFNTPFRLVAMFGPLAFLIFGFSDRRVAAMDARKLLNLFAFYSMLIGLSFSAFFMIYTGDSLGRALLITAGMYAGTSLYGYTTRRDLSSMSSFLVMGLIGVTIAAIVSMFVESAMLQFIVSCVGIIVFLGLTAWETQIVKENYAENAGRQENAKLAAIGALHLYLNFINIFQFIMSFMKPRE